MSASATAPPPQRPAASYDLGQQCLEASDVELVENQLRDFLPTDIFDAHAHVYDIRMLEPDVAVENIAGPAEVRWQAIVARQRAWMGRSCPRQALVFPFPDRQLDCDAANRFLLADLESAPDNFGLLMIRPNDDAGHVARQLDQCDRLRGFKVYHLFAERRDTQNAEPHEYIPQWAWQLAHERGLCIMLHLVRQRSLADPCNQQYIRKNCEQYPNARLILAHAARGFCGQHTVEGIGSLRGLQNVWFDTSAVCESHPLDAILAEFGPSRLLYGSDFPVSEVRGRAVSVGDGFVWLYHDTLDWEKWPMGKLTLSGIESLLAIKRSCNTNRLSKDDIANIFAGNVRQMLQQ
jgi:glutamate-1-semialdehyde 2,1-aminomutase